MNGIVMKQSEILVQSSFDQTMQPSLFFAAEGTEKRPLLVGLHTWSYNRHNQVAAMLPVAEKLNFNLLLPEFRGANLSTNPHCGDACGSEAAKRDIKDAIDYLIAQELVDRDHVFLLGASGGGHMALLMAGYCPEYFKAIGAFVPITDLVAWSRENVDYANHVQACCGSEAEMLRRSPITYMKKIAESNLKIFHGKYDPVVPFSHSKRLYAMIDEYNPRASVYLDIFDGGHEMDMDVAAHWIVSQYQKNGTTTVTG